MQEDFLLSEPPGKPNVSTKKKEFDEREWNLEDDMRT